MANQKLIAGVDSSTQSCKVVIRDGVTGELVREGRATHPDGTEVNPAHWISALDTAIAAAGGLDGVDRRVVEGARPVVRSRHLGEGRSWHGQAGR